MRIPQHKMSLLSWIMLILLSTPNEAFICTRTKYCSQFNHSSNKSRNDNINKKEHLHLNRWNYANNYAGIAHTKANLLVVLSSSVPSKLYAQSSSEDRRTTAGNDTKGGGQRISLSYLQQKRFDEKFQFQLRKINEMKRNQEDIPQALSDTVLGLAYASNNQKSIPEIMEIIEKERTYESDVDDTQKLVLRKTTYTTCLKMCYEAGNSKSALEIISKIRNDETLLPLESDQIKYAVLSLCKNRKETPDLWKNGFELLKSIKIYKNDDDNSNNVLPVEVYNTVINCMEDERRWEDALLLLALMEEKSYHPSPSLATYHAVINILTLSSQIDTAFTLLTSMPAKGVKPFIYTYELMLSSVLSAGKWKLAIELLDMMTSLNIPASTVMYNRVISTCAKKREITSIFRLFETMKKQRVEPDTVTYNSLISACVNSGRNREALNLFDECRSHPKIKPDIITYTNTIRACAKGKMTNKALQLLDDAKERGLAVDVFIYSAVIDVCAKGSMWRQALELLDDMRKNQVLPNEYTYSAVISACGNCGQFERAIGFLQQMKEEGLHVSTINYNVALSALAKAARKASRNNENMEDEQFWRRSSELLQRMKREKAWPDSYSYSALISTCGSEGRFSEAIDLLKEMKTGPYKIQPNKIAYTGAISACAKAGEWKSSLQIFSDMKKDGIDYDVVTCNALASAFMNGNQPDMAYDLWNEMCGKSKSTNKFIDINNNTESNILKPDIITLTTIISTLERANDKVSEGKMDEVFSDAVNMQIVLPEDSMDTLWEKDLSGMNLPVARAACRFIIKNLMVYVKDKQSPCQDLMLITGVGRHHILRMLKVDNEILSSDNEIEEDVPAPQKILGTTALREYVRKVLRQDFDPPIYSFVCEHAEGTIQIKKDSIRKWIDSQVSVS